MREMRFLEPLDTLFLRTNKLFGETGQHGEAQMPPWPSVAAGAIRSRMLVDEGESLSDFGRGQPLSGPLGTVLGTPSEPGLFRIAWFSLAQRFKQYIEPVFPLPADLFADEDDDLLLYLRPQRLPEGLRASRMTLQMGVLRQREATKPEGGVWLNGGNL